jgi:hypothetical protein
VRFWDSSALTALILREPWSDRVIPLQERDSELALWWATPVECTSALSHGRRQGRLTAAEQRVAVELLSELTEPAFEIPPGDELRARAVRLLAVHPLRAADALQLASALVWCDERTAGAGFVTLDKRLREAAAREGFSVLPYAEEVNEEW